MPVYKVHCHFLIVEMVMRPGACPSLLVLCLSLC